jgi:cytochrome c oxidase cbb3-type subunit 3
MDIREDEKNMLIEDHEYDGIKELDNNPPPWIMWVFYLTVIWGFFYFGYYTLSKNNGQDAEYVNEVTTAKAGLAGLSSGGIDEQNIVLLTQEKDLETGKELFLSKTCITCHGQLGQGNVVGPNLTDKAWLNGNTPNNIFKTIKYGNPAKGMLAFKDQLTDKQILELSSFVLLKFKNTNPPNPKEPQGKIYE